MNNKVTPFLLQKITLFIFLSILIVFFILLYNYHIENKNLKMQNSRLLHYYDRTEIVGKFSFYNDDDYLFILSDDNQLHISLLFGKKGLYDTISITDLASDKIIGFNFNKDGNLSSYIYQDVEYMIMTDVGANQPDILIRRNEWIKGFLKIYDLTSNGKINIAIEGREWGDWQR